MKSVEVVVTMARNPNRTEDLPVESGVPDSPIALFGPAQFLRDSDFSDDEVIVTMRGKIRAIQAKFLPKIPLEVVEAKIWPLIVDSSDVIENYRICTALCCVCVGWRNFVDRQKQWIQGSIAWELRAYLDAEDISQYLDG